jgi:hypothetical protein
VFFFLVFRNRISVAFSFEWNLVNKISRFTCFTLCLQWSLWLSCICYHIWSFFFSTKRRRKKKIRRILDDTELGEETKKKIAIEKVTLSMRSLFCRTYIYKSKLFINLYFFRNVKNAWSLWECSFLLHHLTIARLAVMGVLLKVQVLKF